MGIKSPWNLRSRVSAGRRLSEQNASAARRQCRGIRLCVTPYPASFFLVINETVLGSTTYLEATARQTNNQIITACYFRSLEELHRYAHSPLHREAWNWWNGITKTHPHLSISHEVYHAPRGCWENIYVNYHLTGIGTFTLRIEVVGVRW